MPKAQVIHEQGPPEVLRWQDWPVAEPGPGEVRLRHLAIGVNFADLNHRAGVPHPWLVPPRPCVLGFEGVGIVESIGAEVSLFKPGDRVAYGLPPVGAYAEHRTYPAERLLPLPESLDSAQVASLLMKGMTAHYLLHRTYPVRPGDTILVHAAASGTGLLLCQWANALGATVIGTVSSEAKAETAAEAGCHHPIVRGHQDFVARVSALTGGEGVDVVYESIGRETLQRSLDCLRPLGVCASYGHVSGPPEPLDIIADLGARGSLFITRPAIMHYVAKRADLVATGEALFAAIGKGIISAKVVNQYPLKDAVAAHRAMESRATEGATVLIP